jgi:thiaminase
MVFRKTDYLQSAQIVNHIQNEMMLHIDYCKGFGVTKEYMEAAEESKGKSQNLY